MNYIELQSGVIIRDAAELSRIREHYHPDDDPGADPGLEELSAAEAGEVVEISTGAL
jgi:hypothetical protein